MENVMKASIQAAVDAVRNASIRQLSSASWLEHELLPELGLSDVDLNWYPPSLQQFCGKGIRSFRQPN